VLLRVNKPGAHLFLGDCHAIQGDGECNGMGAIEIAATLTVKASLGKAPPRLNHPRIETPTHICTLGCARPLEDAMRIAFEEWCIGWRTTGKFLPRKATCFWARLPKRVAPRWSIQNILTSARSIKKSLRAILADDTATQRESLSDRKKRRHVRAAIASAGLAVDPFDIVGERTIGGGSPALRAPAPA
jgi:hypothetical protein